MNAPLVVGIMLTCGRTKCIGESIASFMQQTYQNKRLIIVDTHPQDMVFDRPLPDNIQIIKVPSGQFQSLSDKTRFALQQVPAEAELMAMWEDDDLWLPFHLEMLVKEYRVIKAMNPPAPIRIGHQKNWFIQGGNDNIPVTIEVMENVAWCRFLFEVNREFWDKAIGNPFDVKFMELNWHSVWLRSPKFPPSYGYRWNSSSLHMSGLYGSMPHEQLFRVCEDKHSSQDVSGITVRLSWRRDYTAMIREWYGSNGIELPELLKLPLPQ